jgi:CheY-like chemotaxis protein
LVLEGRAVAVSNPSEARARVVLVVEDELLLKGTIVACLQDAGFWVVETESGEEAIAFCKSGLTIDVVFTDINLAGAATGWDVADAFRMNRPNVPVLYTSGNLIDPKRGVPGSVIVAKPYRGSDVVNACRRLAVQH